MVRADSGFFDDKLLSFLEEQELPYIVLARLTRWIKSEVTNISEWKDIDDTYSIAEFNKRLREMARALEIWGDSKSSIADGLDKEPW